MKSLWKVLVFTALLSVVSMPDVYAAVYIDEVKQECQDKREKRLKKKLKANKDGANVWFYSALPFIGAGVGVLLLAVFLKLSIGFFIVSILFFAAALTFLIIALVLSNKNKSNAS